MVQTGGTATCRCGWLWVQQARSAVPSPSLGQRHGTTYHARGTLTSLQRATHAIHPHKHQGLCWATVSVLASPAVACVCAHGIPSCHHFAVVLTAHLLRARDSQLSTHARVYALFIICELPQSLVLYLASILTRFQCILLHDAIYSCAIYYFIPLSWPRCIRSID